MLSVKKLAATEACCMNECKYSKTTAVVRSIYDVCLELSTRIIMSTTTCRLLGSLCMLSVLSVLSVLTWTRLRMSSLSFGDVHLRWRVPHWNERSLTTCMPAGKTIADWQCDCGLTTCHIGFEDHVPACLLTDNMHDV